LTFARIESIVIVERGKSMKFSHRFAAVFALATLGILTVDASAYYHPTLGRFVTRDPGPAAPPRTGAAPAAKPTGFLPRDPSTRYTDGMDLYEYVRSQPVTSRDPTGLWAVQRKGESRAEATAGEPRDGVYDRIFHLAVKVGLNTREWKQWVQFTGDTIKTKLYGELTKDELSWGYAICPGEKVTVPNTAYMDAGSYSWGPFGTGLMIGAAMRRSQWREEGYRVVYTGIWATTKELIISHLQSEDIYEYYFIGHGAAGALTKLSDSHDYGPEGYPRLWHGRKGVLSPDTYTRYGIRWMELVACYSNTGASEWARNVSQQGWLRTMRGEVGIRPLVLGQLEVVLEHGTRTGER